MAKITFWGGFHCSNEITITVPDTPSNGKGIFGLRTNHIRPNEFIDNYCTEYQMTRLRRHFCGIKGCKCGSYLRVKDFEVKW
jgi:hypothetical protein